jgi:hypothetical protein
MTEESGMAEQHEDDTRPLAAGGGHGEAAPDPSEGAAQAHPGNRPEADTPHAEQAAGGSPGTGAPQAAYTAGGAAAPPGGGRFRRWSRSAPAQFVAVGLLAGLVGGLVGGGIVAAVDGGGHDHPQFVRIERGMPPWWGPRQFRRPQHERFFPMRPGGPEEPRPSPTPTS